MGAHKQERIFYFQHPIDLSLSLSCEGYRKLKQSVEDEANRQSRKKNTYGPLNLRKILLDTHLNEDIKEKYTFLNMFQGRKIRAVYYSMPRHLQDLYKTNPEEFDVVKESYKERVEAEIKEEEEPDEFIIQIEPEEKPEVKPKKQEKKRIDLSKKTEKELEEYISNIRKKISDNKKLLKKLEEAEKEYLNFILNKAD